MSDEDARDPLDRGPRRPDTANSNLEAPKLVVVDAELGCPIGPGRIELRASFVGLDGATYLRDYTVSRVTKIGTKRLVPTRSLLLDVLSDPPARLDVTREHVTVAWPVFVHKGYEQITIELPASSFGIDEAKAADDDEARRAATLEKLRIGRCDGRTSHDRARMLARIVEQQQARDRLAAMAKTLENGGKEMVHAAQSKKTVGTLLAAADNRVRGLRRALARNDEHRAERQARMESRLSAANAILQSKPGPAAAESAASADGESAGAGVESAGAGVE